MVIRIYVPREARVALPVPLLTSDPRRVNPDYPPRPRIGRFPGLSAQVQATIAKTKDSSLRTGPQAGYG